MTWLDFVSRAPGRMAFLFLALALPVLSGCVQRPADKKVEDCWLLSAEALAEAKSQGRCLDAFAYESGLKRAASSLAFRNSRPVSLPTATKRKPLSA